MDILNFISWIKGSRIVTTANPTQTLLPLGLKDARRDDGYLAGAITLSDFISQITPITPAVTSSIWANGFKVVGCINENLVLPDNSNLEYQSPLAMCVGKTLTVPAGTTLTIV